MENRLSNSFKRWNLVQVLLEQLHYADYARLIKTEEHYRWRFAERVEEHICKYIYYITVFTCCISCQGCSNCLLNYLSLWWPYCPSSSHLIPINPHFRLLLGGGAPQDIPRQLACWNGTHVLQHLPRLEIPEGQKHAGGLTNWCMMIYTLSDRCLKLSETGSVCLIFNHSSLGACSGYLTCPSFLWREPPPKKRILAGPKWWTGILVPLKKKHQVYKWWQTNFVSTILFIYFRLPYWATREEFFFCKTWGFSRPPRCRFLDFFGWWKERTAGRRLHINLKTVIPFIKKWEPKSFIDFFFSSREHTS